MSLPRPKSEAEYLGLFSSKQTIKYMCDASILYMYSDTAAKSIFDYEPNAKILIVLRNPIEAAFSWYCQMRYTGNETLGTFDEALEVESNRWVGNELPKYGLAAECPKVLFYRKIMSYPDQLRKFKDLFPKDQIKIILHDDFLKNSEQIFGEVADFLNIDKTFKPEFKVVNPRKERKNPKFHAFLKKYFAAITKQLLPVRFRLALIRKVDNLTTRESSPEKISQSAKLILQDEYHTSINELEIMLNRDLSTWKG